MRSYGQYCALAKALDVIGDRWTLLIVRELTLRGACRYTDLRDGLPGIATNLLADRLRELERTDVVSRREAPPPVATTLFELTERGRALSPVLHEIGRWGVELMVSGPTPEDQFRSRWLTWPAELFLTDNEPQEPPVTLALDAGGEPVVLETADGHVHARMGAVENPDATLSGPPHALLGVLSGHLDLDSARSLGLEYRGSPRVLARVRPHATAGSP